MGGESDTLVHLFHNPAQTHDPFCWETPFAMPQGTDTASSSGSMVDPSFHGLTTPNNNINPCLENWEFIPQGPPEQIPNTSLECFPLPTVTDYASTLSQLDTQTASFHVSESYSVPGGSTSSIASHRHKRRRPSSDPRTRRDSDPWGDNSCSMSLSPFAASHLVMATSNRSLISGGLLRIYHDVLENNLGCWLAEDTCPYKMQSLRPRDIVPAHQQLSSSPGAQVQQEWGVAWSNRMYRRVRQLDRVAQATGTVRLSRSESQAASRTLDLVIMAFATQWAQGTRRSERLNTESWHDDSRSESESGHDEDEFEQTLQHAVWEQAKKALQEVSDVECFRVVYAELIFGLTQKPWVVDSYRDGFPRGAESIDGDGDFMASIMKQAMDIINAGGPPIFAERAARKIHALKYRFEARETSTQEAIRLGRKTREGDGFPRAGIEETRTFGLLYWLAVMIDTVSSSVNHRPVVVPDEECEHDSAQIVKREPTSTRTLSRRWELDLYAQENTEQPSPLHWPCPYSEATRAVARSTSIKVLLFRYVSYLQNALRKQEHGHAIEEIIQSATSIYRYWNRTHGCFFRDLVKNYDTVPARIKGWFLCIGIHWHLACLTLADLIELVDDNHLGLEQSRAERLDANIVMRIRHSSSIELADLAEISTPRDMGSVSQLEEQLPGLHFAVSESPLLTEPWTVLLIRAFTKSCIFHIESSDELKRHEWQDPLGHRGEELQVSMRRAKSCARALGYLGTKSEMSRAVSKLLTRQILALQGNPTSITPVSVSRNVL